MQARTEPAAKLGDVVIDVADKLHSQVHSAKDDA